MVYLNKMISALGKFTLFLNSELIHGVTTNVDSYKVIAGLDPDSTNTLLQMVAETVLKKVIT